MLFRQVQSHQEESTAPAIDLQMMANFTSNASRVILLISALLSLAGATLLPRQTCVVPASGTNATDDAPAILEAFRECGTGGTILFSPDTTYYVNSIMNVTWLEDAEVDIQGTLLWSTDIGYWLNNSMPVGYQNQSTAFILGGNNVYVHGNGVGLLNGNGQYWYTYISKQSDTSNYPGRPHAITLMGLNNSRFSDINFYQSQMWTMSIIYSHNLTLENVLVNNTATSGAGSNTDGADTIRSSNIAFNNWTVYNGDDSISVKANSTNISITNSHFYNGLGIAIGSIGQYDGVYEAINGVTVDNITYTDTTYAFYFKAWSGTSVGYPPNGGGGGIADVSNMNVTNLHVQNLKSSPIEIGSCTSFSGGGTPANCTNSEVQIYDISVLGVDGTSASSHVASLACSAVRPCYNLTIEDVNVTETTTGAQVTGYTCAYVGTTIGFDCPS
ncbi:putative exo-polygalacturonase [Coniella lustricola]|uniref:Putative exo-polygalacturonase n=1 Tax=Coniella lustricola TaxID=2025994 RepID=A0A2T2ZY56_9PEZI|nr:putative exo-polygalacturonase [Coniella lustricola]